MDYLSYSMGRLSDEQCVLGIFKPEYQEIDGQIISDIPINDKLIMHGKFSMEQATQFMALARNAMWN